MAKTDSNPCELILASASPRRSELLRQIGMEFTVLPADIDEQVLPGEQPDVYVRRMALEKAAAGMDLCAGKKVCVLAADTAVVIKGRILGKPRDREDALEMLVALSNTTHQVMSAVTVSDGERVEDMLSVTDVSFGPVTSQQAEVYWGSGEPADKAGAYGIQGQGAIFVRSLRGSYTGVVGLPLYET
ncbi:MAG: Maf family protein, partial [Gammaproteobacteria bacterium]